MTCSFRPLVVKKNIVKEPVYLRNSRYLRIIGGSWCPAQVHTRIAGKAYIFSAHRRSSYTPAKEVLSLLLRQADLEGILRQR